MLKNDDYDGLNHAVAQKVGDTAYDVAKRFNSVTIVEYFDSKNVEW
jgi:hypothetical protein